MITDKKWYFQDDVTTAGDDITATTTAEISTQIIDLRKYYGSTDIPNNSFFDGETDMIINVRLKTLGTATIETVQLKDSADGSTFVAVESITIPQANFVANGMWRFRVPIGIRRYIRLSFTNTTSGSNVLNAWLASR